MRSFSSVLLFLLGTTLPGMAQVVEVPGGKGAKVEFVGLKRRKAQDVFDQYRAKNPGKPVHA